MFWIPVNSRFSKGVNGVVIGVCVFWIPVNSRFSKGEAVPVICEPSFWIPVNSRFSKGSNSQRSTWNFVVNQK